MTIKRITLKNFQIHKNITIDLSDFTAIVGPSSAGKSAILRALSWLFYGEWDSTYPNDPEQETAIAIQLHNGTVWGRFRKGKRNWAMVKHPGEKSIAYQDFGDIIPGILDEVNVRPIKVGPSRVNLNFSMQDDPIFMVHESKPAKAQWIGRLYGAHIINQMLRIMSKDKRAVESEKKNIESEAERLREELDRYSDLEAESATLDRIMDSIAMLEQLVECQRSMTEITIDYDAIKNGKSILGADTDKLRIDIVRLEDLVAAQNEALSVAREEFALNQSRSLKADTNQLRLDLERLQAAREELAQYRECNHELREVGAELKECLKSIKSREDYLEIACRDVTNSMFSSGRCPICSSKPRKLDSGEVSKNLKALMESSK